MKTWQIYVYGGLAFLAAGVYLWLKERDEDLADEVRVICGRCAEELDAPDQLDPPAAPAVKPEPLPPATAEVVTPA